MGGQRLPYARVGRAQDPGDLDVDRLGRRLAVLPRGRAIRLQAKVSQSPLQPLRAEVIPSSMPAALIARPRVKGCICVSHDAIAKGGQGLVPD